MNTDPADEIGRIREQIETENKTRRNYSRKWLKFYQETPWRQIYNQDEISRQIKQDLKNHEPLAYPNEGESYFLSPEMQTSLKAVCRCGRPRSDLHLLKCLQRSQNKCLNSSVTAGNKTNEILKEPPGTSSGFVGRHRKQPVYKQWEDSMKYVSSMVDMPGGKITAVSYNTIVIG